MRNVTMSSAHFQEGKGTLDQIFLLCMVISLAKTNKSLLYIGFYEKAFDKVSCVLFLKSLIKLGVGVGTIKSMYMVTKCVLKSGQKCSGIFQTYSSIKQGAPSSVIVF